MDISPETNAALAEVFKLEPKEETASVLTGPMSKRRLVVRFDPDTMQMWPDTVKSKRDSNRLKGAVVTHMVRNEGARTPTGGRFTSIRFTVSYKGLKWVGQTKNDTDIVRLRVLPGTNGDK